METKSIPLEQVRKHLRYGDRLKIAKMHEVSLQYVGQVLNPKNKKMSLTILDSAIEIAMKRKKVTDDLQERISAL